MLAAPALAAPKKPAQKLNIAVVGLGVRGLGNAEKCGANNIVALCDVDWGVAATAFTRFPDAVRYKDYRVMLDKETNIDAVVISTPDHTHAVIAAEAMRRGKHVFVETPLAHSVWEARELTRIAAETGAITQMGIERHSGAGLRKAVEMVWGGGLGRIREVHAWTNRPQWPQGAVKLGKAPKLPKNMDWDIWLGPASKRAFNPAYHPYRWRGWRDFGTGALGAMGCHTIDLAFWSLKLGEATSFTVSAECSGDGSATYPESSTIRYTFPERGVEPALTLTWNDGGRKPPEPELLPKDRGLGSNGSILIGDKHPMMFGPTVLGTTPGQVGPRPLPEFAEITPVRKAPKIPSIPEGDWKAGNRHIGEWLACCRSGKQPSANFAYSGPLTEIVLMGNVALLSGESVTWRNVDGQLTVDGSDKVAQLVKPEYRRGWSL